MSSDPATEPVRALRECVESYRHDMLSLLERVVNIESPTDHPAGVNQVGAVFGEALTDLGLAVRTLPSADFGDHLVAEGGAPGGVHVLLMGHMDTVYPLGTGWPYSQSGERAFGPGVVDMKSGDVALVFALKALRDTGGIPVSVRVVLNSDEEPGSPESRGLLPDLVDGIDWAFVLEPSEPDGTIVRERKGVGIFRFAIHGRAAHAGQEPEKGLSANRALAQLVLAAEGLADPVAGTTVNAGRIAGGTAPYVIPEFAEADVDVRVPSVEERARMEAALRGLVVTGDDTRPEVTLTGGFHRPPMPQLPRTAELVAAISAAAATAGQRVRFGRSGAASDGNDLVSLGIPTIDGIGPIGGRAHSTSEYLELPSFSERTLLLALTLRELAERGRERSSEGA
jgi:glutamate carboxypeptidase